MGNCSVFWNNFSGDTPDSLIQFFVFHCIAVCFLGLLCNVVALWCVAACPRTRPAVKVLLCALFSSTLLVCLLVASFMAHLGISKLWSKEQAYECFFIAILGILMETEIHYILVIAFLRAVAMWSPVRHQAKLRTSVALVVGVAVYVTATNAALFVLYSVFEADMQTLTLTSRVMTVLHYVLPTVLTLACYSSMIFVVRRNKRRLAATPDKAGTGQVMDQATRAMLAVFISNLVLITPQFVFVCLPTSYFFSSNIFFTSYIIFFIHLFINPLVFVCFNLHHRQRVLQALRSCLHWFTCRPLCALPHAASTLPLHQRQNVAEGS